MQPIVSLWARTALVWFLITICFGMYMGMTQAFHLSPSHAHMGLLGWLSAAVFAFLYGVAREGREGSKAPTLHWALHNLGVTAMTGGLLIFLSGRGDRWEVLIPIGGMFVVIGVLWLTIMLWPRLAPR